MLATRGSFCARRPGLSLNNLCFVFVNYGTKINLINGWKPSTLRDSWQGRSKKKSANENNKETEKARENDNVCSRCVGDSQQVWKFNATQSLSRVSYATRCAHTSRSIDIKKKKKTGKKQNLNDRNRDRINNKNNKSSAKNYYYNNCKSNNNNNSNNQWVI